MPLLSVVLSAGLMLASSAAPLADEASGVKFSEQQIFDGSPFVCLGAGVRRVFLFKVYAMAYCVDARTAQRAQNGPMAGEAAFFADMQRAPRKLAVLHFLRDVSAPKLAQGFREGLKDHLPAAAVEKLVSVIPGDVAAGEEVRVATLGDGVLVFEMGDVRRELQDAALSRKLWDIWLGPQSLTPSLQRSIVDRATGGAEATL